MLLVSLDIDGTMEFGEPPGPVTLDVVRTRAVLAGIAERTAPESVSTSP